MTKTFNLSDSAYEKLRDKLIQDYGVTSIIISWRMQRELGCQFRRHIEDYNTGYTFKLDFYDDMMQTMFVLKYAEYLSD